MLTHDRRRRLRRRSMASALLLAGAVALVVVVLAGGIIHVHQASASYRRAVNRSFAVQGSVLVHQSNPSGQQLRQLMATMPTLRRRRLQMELDQLVSDTSSQAAAAVD